MSAPQPVRIRAAVCRAFNAPLTIEEVMLPPPGPQQVRIRVETCSICHSDLTLLAGGWGGRLPGIAGHEVAGTIAQAGTDSGYRAGDRIIATLIRACGSCRACRRRAPALCEHPPPGESLQDRHGKPLTALLNVGGFAEQVTLHTSQIAPIPDCLPADEAALLSCGVLTGWGAVAVTAAPPPQSTIAVVGCGGVGMNCLQAAADTDAGVICAIDRHDSKLQLAKQFGATCTINAAAGSEAARALGGNGFDYVFMAAGGAAAVEYAVTLLAPLGTLVLAGMQAGGDQPTIDTTAIAHYQQRILGSKMGGAVIPGTIERMIEKYQQKRLQLKSLIARRYPLDDINLALQAAARGDTLKHLICPQQPA